MAKGNRYGEPWKRGARDGQIDGVTSRGERLYIADRHGFNWPRFLDRVLLTVNACAGLTAKELKRGVVAKRTRSKDDGVASKG